MQKTDTEWWYNADCHKDGDVRHSYTNTEAYFKTLRFRLCVFDIQKKYIKTEE